MEPSPERTAMMNDLVSRVSLFCQQVDLSVVPRELFTRNEDGSRVIALALVEPVLRLPPELRQTVKRLFTVR